MPWEIYRPSHLSPVPRPIDLYTKEGELPAPGGYTGHIAVIPEYEVGIVILAAGDGSFDAFARVLNAATAEIIQQLDVLARERAENAYVGRYVGSSGNGSSAQLVLAIDEGPGIKVQQWTNLGVDMLSSLVGIQFGLNNKKDIDARIYPIGEDNRWRLQLEPIHAKDDPYRGAITLDACWTWLKVDSLRYGRLPVDEFDFEVTLLEGGIPRVEGLRVPGLRQALVKVS